MRISINGRRKRENIARLQGFVCYLCKMRKISGTFHIDHKIALCNGGGNEIENLGFICKLCHREKTKIDRAINRDGGGRGK